MFSGGCPPTVERNVMKKYLMPLLVVVFALLVSAPTAPAQGSKNGPDPSTIRDPDLEKDSLHNLEVARQYFKLRKAYVASLQRCEEIIAGNPTFSKIDEVLFIAGGSNLYLSEGKGKQKPSLYKRAGANVTPEQFREEARGYFSQLVENYPDSKFKTEAMENLKALGGPKTQDPRPKPNLKP
jgi:outer membrane protein assembly factor BamD (BamD/ComL family)